MRAVGAARNHRCATVAGKQCARACQQLHADEPLERQVTLDEGSVFAHVAVEAIGVRQHRVECYPRWQPLRPVPFGVIGWRQYFERVGLAQRHDLGCTTGVRKIG